MAEVAETVQVSRASNAQGQTGESVSNGSERPLSTAEFTRILWMRLKVFFPCSDLSLVLLGFGWLAGRLARVFALLRH